jgi:MGT family glycosyltransferase
MRAIMTRLFNGGTRTLNRSRAELGLAPIAGVIDQFLHVDRLLVMTSASFDFPTEHLPAHVQYVGPVLDDPTWAPVNWETPWPRDNSDPIVLVGFSSTFQNQGEVIRRCVEALSSLKVRGIVTLGEQLNVSEFASTRNVVVARSAPHQIILEQAAAIITHCGHGTAMKAMFAGVPAVCIPMGRDQNDTAARIVARGAGIRLKTKSSAARIAEAVRSVLNDPAYRNAARALGARIRAELAAKDPADALLESLHRARDVSAASVSE